MRYIAIWVAIAVGMFIFRAFSRGTPTGQALFMVDLKFSLLFATVLTAFVFFGVATFGKLWDALNR